MIKIRCIMGRTRAVGKGISDLIYQSKGRATQIMSLLKEENPGCDLGPLRTLTHVAVVNLDRTFFLLCATTLLP